MLDMEMMEESNLMMEDDEDTNLDPNLEEGQTGASASAVTSTRWEAWPHLIMKGQQYTLGG